MKLTDLNESEAKSFFMESQNYGTLELPDYFNFKNVLSAVQGILLKAPLSDKETSKLINSAKETDRVNYTLIHNKDGKYAWRPLQLIHPVLYVMLVNEITTTSHWQELIHRFKCYEALPKIHCTSIPRIQEPATNQKQKAYQILTWWSEFEQASLEQTLKYKVMISTDISDCYGSIYTHAISWALHGKDIAKQNRTNSKLLGNNIDKYIRAMQFGQTNGIPQGSVLMDFIAELILGYVDEQLDSRLSDSRLSSVQGKDYYILRYRDDYRIYTNNTLLGEQILKELTFVLAELGMHLNSAKTHISTDIILGSLKPDKLTWLSLEKNFESLTFEKQLLLVYEHASHYPNCGSIMKPLTTLHQSFEAKRCSTPEQQKACIAIVVELAYRNPRVYQICMALIAQLLRLLTLQEQQQIVTDLVNRFKTLPNTTYLKIWLQRIMLPCNIQCPYSEDICKLVLDSDVLSIWNHNWLEKHPTLFKKMRNTRIIDDEKIKALTPTMTEEEVNLFIRNYNERYQG